MQQKLPLRDIHLTDQLEHLADTVSWWPPAIGWWVLLFLLMTLLYIGVMRWLRYRKNSNAAAVAEARQILQAITMDYRKNGKLGVLISAISALIRRLCISLFPREHTANLLADDWLLFLDKTMAKNPNDLTAHDKPFSQGIGRVLSTGPYRRNPEGADGEQLLLLCQQWISQVEKYAKTYQQKVSE